MTIIYIIIGCALASISLKLIKALDNTNNKQNNNNNSSITIRDGMNLYFGKVLGKLFIIIILISILFLIPLFLG